MNRQPIGYVDTHGLPVVYRPLLSG